MPFSPWFDPKTDPSKFRALLKEVRTRAFAERGDGYREVQALVKAIDDYAEAATGRREYFWNRPH